MKRNRKDKKKRESGEGAAEWRIRMVADMGMEVKGAEEE